MGTSLRTPLIVVIVLGILLVLGAVVAVSASGGSALGGAPGGSPVAVPDTGAGSNVVLLSADAAEHPDGPAVREQLQRHYDAINDLDYDAWTGTVVTARSDTLSEGRWREDYATTTDGTIRVDRIDADGDGLLVRVRFTSTQDVADAPQALPVPRICWRTTLPLTRSADGTPPRIDRTGGGSSVAEAC